MKIKSLSLTDKIISRYPVVLDSNDYKIAPGLVVLKKTADSHYLLFSPFLHKIHLISEETYNQLISDQKYLKNNEELKNSGILIPYDYNFFPKNYSYSEIKGFAISLTTQCNLRCVYCFTKGGEISTKINNFDYIKSIIDYAAIHNRDKKINLNLLSTGEPTLAFGLIKKITEYLNYPKFDKVNINLVTNGTFSKEIAQWLINNMERVTITMDGPPEIHDKQRPFKDGRGSSKIIEKNIKFFTKNRKNLDFGVNSVITNHSADKQIQILNYFHSLGVRRLNFSVLSTYGRCLGACSNPTTTINLNKYIRYWLKARELAEEYSIELNSNLLSIGKLRSRGCGYFGFLADGRVSLCSGVNELSKNNNLSKLFIIGHYNKIKNKIIINKKRQKTLADRSNEKIFGCNKCAYKWTCGGGCTFDAFVSSGNLYAPDSKCKARKNIYNKFLTYKAEKHFLRIKPYLEKNKNGLYFSMVFNKFRLENIKGNEKIFGNSIVSINSNQNLEKLANRIIKTHKAKRRTYDTFLILLLFKFEKKDLNLNSGKKIIKFLSELKKQGIFFKVLRPLPRCIYPSKNYKEVTKLFNLPKSCLECLELFTINDGTLTLCTGEKYNLRDFNDRKKIYDKFVENKKINKECKFCRYFIRNQCNTCLSWSKNGEPIA